MSSKPHNEYMVQPIFVARSVRLQSTCSPRYILIWDFISSHTGLQPIFPFGSDFFSGQDPIMPGPPRGVPPTGQLLSRRQRERRLVALSSVRVPRLSTRPGGKGLINDKPY